MKTASDPRHRRRQRFIKWLFAYSFQPQKNLPQALKKLIEMLPKVDEQIRKAAPQFPLEKINKIDLSILRLAVFELTYQRTQPKKVIIDEAVELGKEFGSENSPKFINGVLGTILKNKKLAKSC